MPESGVQFGQVLLIISKALAQPVHAWGHSHARVWHPVHPGAILCISFTALRKLCMLTAMLMLEPGIQFSQVHRSVSQCLGQAVHASGHAHTRAWYSVQPGALKHLPVPWATYHACWRPCSCQSHACSIHRVYWCVTAPMATCACWRPCTCQSQACSERRASNTGVLGGTDMCLLACAGAGAGGGHGFRGLRLPQGQH